MPSIEIQVAVYLAPRHIKFFYIHQDINHDNGAITISNQSYQPYRKNYPKLACVSMEVDEDDESDFGDDDSDYEDDGGEDFGDDEDDDEEPYIDDC